MHLIFLVLSMAVLSASQAAATEEKPPVAVLSYNIRVDFDGASWPRRRETVRKVLTGEPYDLIAIQEASELMIADYQRMLSDYYYVVGERSDGHRGDQNWYEFNPIFYRRDRFERLSAGSVWIGEDPNRPGDTLKDSKWHGRVLNWIVLKDRKSGKRLALGNVHIHGAEAERGVDIVMKAMREAAQGAPIILAGDFNSTPNSKAYVRVVDPGAHHLRDALVNAAEHSGIMVTTIGEGEAVPSGAEAAKAGVAGRRIDYVFTDAEFAVERYAVPDSSIEPGLFASDHLPVSVILHDCSG